MPKPTPKPLHERLAALVARKLGEVPQQPGKPGRPATTHQAILGKRMDVSRERVRQWLSGDKPLDIATLKRIVAAIGARMSDLGPVTCRCCGQLYHDESKRKA